MKCPIDQTEMEEGRIGDVSTEYKWRPADIPFNTIKNPMQGLIAWKCPKCGKVEFTIKEDK